jgi:DNA-binding response OmpR family regulator
LFFVGILPTINKSRNFVQMMGYRMVNKNIKILLVDDDADTRELIQMILEKHGYPVQTTGHGQSAITLLGHERIDLVLLDIMMPDVDGLNVLSSIRSFTTAPVLMITALSDRSIMAQAYQMGANDYLVKPFSFQKLLERVDRLAAQVEPLEEAEPADWTTQYQLDESKDQLIHGGLLVDMTPIELKLLKRLMQSAYAEVSKSELFTIGWGAEILPQRTVMALVDNTIRNIQLKLEPDPESPKVILPTENGYSFRPD